MNASRCCIRDIVAKYMEAVDVDASVDLRVATRSDLRSFRFGGDVASRRRRA